MIDAQQIATLVRERTEANQLVFKAGYDEGYRKGFLDAISQAKRITEETFKTLKEKQ